MIKHLENVDDFDKIIKDSIWLVDFYADWCGPCKIMGNTLEELDNNILKVNVDLFPLLAKEFGIMSIPTICYFKYGDLIDRKIGLQSKDEILNTISKI